MSSEGKPPWLNYTDTKLVHVQLTGFFLFIFFLICEFRYHSRVLYIDIDIHHGDGVQVTKSIV